jgi:hypothetical protein
MTDPDPNIPSLGRRLAWFFVLLGLYLTLRGYHSRDGDQAYRLPLLLHQQDPAVFASDPFVRAFDAFNPHRGSLAILDLASRPFGLSAGLFALFLVSFALTAVGVDRLARGAWPECGPWIGLLAFGFLLMAKAGNLGTNHLFESMYLDRLLAMGLGWYAIAVAVGSPRRIVLAAWPLGLAAYIHPSLGLQLALASAGARIGWLVLSRQPLRQTTYALLALGVALLPAVLYHGSQSAALLRGLPEAEFRLLAVQLQGPQHMLPHLWRMPQWLAFAAYFVLAGIALFGRRVDDDPARDRLTILLATTLLGLLTAWVGIEVVGSLRLTLFQPFRLATLARGLAIILIAGHAWKLATSQQPIGRLRALLLFVGLSGDWTMVAVCVAETGFSVGSRLRGPAGNALGFAGLAWGVWFLSLHDTEFGNRRILYVLAAWALAERLAVRLPGLHFPTWNRRRMAWSVAVAWIIPASAAALPLVIEAPALAERYRFAAIPVDDLERLAVWCREHTPVNARFIGPPGPKTFRLWSTRSVAFNRASSPYHAEGLADWASRYRDHVGFKGTNAAFVRAYLNDRHGLERHFQELSDEDKVALARRQGADHILAAAPAGALPDDAPLELLHVEGVHAAYRVRPTQVAAGLR